MLCPRSGPRALQRRGPLWSSCSFCLHLFLGKKVGCLCTQSQQLFFRLRLRHRPESMFLPFICPLHQRQQLRVWSYDWLLFKCEHCLFICPPGSTLLQYSCFDWCYRFSLSSSGSNIDGGLWGCGRTILWHRWVLRSREMWWWRRGRGHDRRHGRWTGVVGLRGLVCECW